MSYHSKLCRIKREYQSDVEESSENMKKIRMLPEQKIYVVLLKEKATGKLDVMFTGYRSFKDAEKAILLFSTHPHPTDRKDVFECERYEYIIEDVCVRV